MKQWHFDFCDWEEAFAFFYRKRCGEQLISDGEEGEPPGEVLGSTTGDPNLVFVISTASYTSGYWIEPKDGAQADSETTVYRTVEEVRALEQRIRDKRESTVNLSLGGVII